MESLKSIQSIVRQEVQDFIHRPITVAQGYQFNQYENVKKTHLYLNSKFYSGHNDSTSKPLIEGMEYIEDEDRIFFNITLPRVKGVKRFFDVNIGDIVLDEINPQSDIALQLLNNDFMRYATSQKAPNDNTLSEDLNEFVHPLIEYGSLVVEMLPNAKPQVIPLQNYFVDPSVKRSKDSRFNIIKYTMTPTSLRAKIKEGWDEDAVESLIRNAGDTSRSTDAYEDNKGVNQIMSSPYIEVYKRYGYLQKGLVDGSESDEEVFAVAIIGANNDLAKKTGKADKDEVLFVEEWKKDMPIIDTHLVKTHGRWQGIGIVELLYPIQKRMNEICNQKRISMEISALHLFQTADPSVLNNILTDLENGDVVQSKIPNAIQPIVNEERNLPAWNSEEVTYETQADKLSFANDLLAGGDIPTSTPATNAVIQNNNQVLVHLQDRQNFTNFLGNTFIKPFVVPQLIKDFSDEHYLRFASGADDVIGLEDKMVELGAWLEIKKRAIVDRKAVYSIMKDEVMDDVRKEMKKKGVNRYVKMMKDYYKNKIGDIIVIIGDEKKDMQRVANNTMNFLQMIQDPNMLSDPVNKLFVTEYGKEMGIDTTKMEIAFAQRQQGQEQMQAQQVEQVEQGGGQMPAQQPQEKDPALATVQ